ncbi:MAG: thymidine phosphorylase [Myxococcota bacterium]
MIANDVLRCVRDGERVEPSVLRDFVNGISDGSIPDYQATAFLMAVYCRGMDDDLVAELTLAMRDSGDVIDLSHVDGSKVDKHSTGGVGDKISIPLAPIVAACGVPVPMISGRGLGHSGGTLDKLESIPGFRVDLSVEHFRAQVAELGCCLIGQTGDVAPADRKLYALRDVTATVESIPLITASILSKKLAEGIDALVLDVKVGRGAFMKTEDEARALATSLVRVGESAGKKVRAVLTTMEQPLGRFVGNALEVRESVDILRGEGPADTTELTLLLAAQMLVLGGRAESIEEAQSIARASIDDGSALEKLGAIVEAQGGDRGALLDPERLPKAAIQRSVVAPEGGVVSYLDAFTIGMAGVRLGGGRERAEDAVDPAVGFEFMKKLGDSVQPGETLCVVHANDEAKGEAAEKAVLEAYRFASGPVVPPPLVIDVLE